MHNILINSMLYLLEHVVNSLSLALTELLKEFDTIIGVKVRSQSYFRTKVLNGSL